MAEREKVMTWLEICGKNNDCSGCCPYNENGFGEYGQCLGLLMADAYELLKEQEPKPELPVDIRPANERFATMKLGYCPKCGKKINSVDHKNYCGECSQAVKWE